jgi:tetratricopeptide (TPR) repeat protein
MDQLVVLHEIYDSFSKGSEGINAIDPASIEGDSSQQVGRLLESAKQGTIDQEICSDLADRLSDVYEMKRLGDICRKAGVHPLAIKSYNKAMTLNSDKNIRPVLLNNLGQVYVRQGDLGRANIYYKKAMQCFESLGDSSGLAHVLGNMASAHRRAKNWDLAIEHCYRSLKIFEGLGEDSGIAQMTGSLARIYADMGEGDLAAKYFEKSLNDFQRLGDRRSTAWILDRLGQISSGAKDWDSALRYYNKSLTAFEELKAEQSMGIVLSNMGKMYVMKGDFGLAADHLEKAMKRLSRDMQPVYQNTASCMASAYSALAAGHMTAGEQAKSEGAKKDMKKELDLASQFYARASDRYLEISSTRGFDIPELKASAGITRSLSYIAQLQAEPSDEEAVALSERASSALDSAIVNTEGAQRTDIETFQRVMIGMQEALSSGLANGEPWRLTKSLAKSIEDLLGGACRFDGPGRGLCDALKSLGGAIDAERQRKDPSSQIKAAVSNLKMAKRGFEDTETDQGNDYALRISKASSLLEGLTNVNSKGFMDGSASDLLNYRAHREALLMVGWILAKDAIDRVSRTDRVYVWDDSQSPMVIKSERASEVFETDHAVDSSRKVPEPIPEPIPDGPDAEHEMIEIALSDTPKEPISKEDRLVPIETGIARTIAQVVLMQKEDKDTGNVDRIGTFNRRETIDPDAGRADLTYPTMENIDTDDARDSMSDTAVPDASGLEDMFSQMNAIRLVKAMSVVVVVLVAIDVILYLI